MTERCRYCGTLDDDEDWHTPTRCREDMRAKIEAYCRCEDAAFIAGREEERAAIVAWLRAKPPVSVLAAFLAAEIERGEHAGVKAMTRYWYIRHATNGPLCSSAFGARIIPGLVRRYAARSMAMVDLRAVRLQRPSDALAYRLVRVTVKR